MLVRLVASLNNVAEFIFTRLKPLASEIFSTTTSALLEPVRVL